MKDKQEIIPKSVASKLTNIAVIAIGNILVVAGESLIRYGKENINSIVNEENKSERLSSDSDDFFDL